MKPITTSTYSFEKLIENNNLYVDKTAFLYKLIKDGSGIFFCSRPRRFGKSLTISCLKAIFQGQRKLFQGLFIDTTAYTWPVYPVIHLDFGRCDSRSSEELERFLKLKLKEICEIYHVVLSEDKASNQFADLIHQLSKINKVVILIDEYDKPLLEHLQKPTLEDIRFVLEGFYAVIKSEDAFERFVFMTGVTKFSKVSVFSKLNNLKDITMHADYATMFGYTQQEMVDNFGENISTISKVKNIDRQLLIADIKKWYNGYRFFKDAETVYNPVSIGNFFEERGEFQNYWFATGTPTFLMKLIKEQEFDFVGALTNPIDGITFDSFEMNKISLLPLLIQTGYLTIRDFETENNITSFYLGFPNMEVEMAFESYLLDELVGAKKDNIGPNILSIAHALKRGDLERVIEKLQWFYNDLGYENHIKLERFYQSIFFTIFRMLNFMVSTEVSTNKGRVDAVIELPERIYLFEFKLNDSALSAMNQINQMKYYQKFLARQKPIHLVGVGFSYAERNIVDWLEEVVNV